MTRTIPGPLPASPPRQREGALASGDRFGVHRAHIHGGYLVDSGFEPGTLRLQGRGLNSRPPRPHMERRKMKFWSTSRAFDLYK
ncbi:hypothetical protein AVEN_263760-1 [Araneus ventricosus]|uniref:Uncharacterized protein n=1 Tax=Araneus ventricosus TaxID=182803 RepID=A0A4Y2ATW5_ARAVE|nr:hypothetical protein AVEN_263760-1 [Araneus ventricosus]